MITAILFMSIGGGLLVWGIAQVLLARDSRDWPTTPGRVILSALAEEPDDEGGKPQWSPNVQYTYVVNGEQFTGNRLMFGGTLIESRVERVRRVLRRYPFGTPVTVHYDPDDPRKAVVECSTSGGIYVVFLAALAFLGFGLVALLDPFS